MNKEDLLAKLDACLKSAKTMASQCTLHNEDLWMVRVKFGTMPETRLTPDDYPMKPGTFGNLVFKISLLFDKGMISLEELRALKHMMWEVTSLSMIAEKAWACTSIDLAYSESSLQKMIDALKPTNEERK